MVEKKLLYVITTGIFGGAQTHLYDLISCVPASNEVHVVMGEKAWLWQQLANKNIVLHQIPELLQPISLVHDISAMWKIKRLIHGIHPDLIHCHSTKAGFLGRIAAHMEAVPVIYTVHGWAFTDGVPGKKRKLYRLFEQVAARFTDQFICVSEYDRQLGMRCMPASRSKMLTVHNGVRPLTIVKKLDALPNYGDQITRLVMVARFNKQKDQALLVKAIAKLRQEKIPVQLSFVGEGPSAMAVEKLAEDLDVVDCVQFLGARDDVNQILRSCDAFVLISKWEGFPISILEAMRQGLPVVASDVGGVSEAVCDGVTGFLVSRGNLTELVAALRKICLQPDIRSRLGLNGKSFYEENFTLNIMTKKIFDIYDRILGNRGVS